MQKILIFIDWFLPGYKSGGPLSSISNLVNHLNSHFEFYIVTRDTDYCENQPYQTIESNSWNKLLENVHVFYFSKNNLTYKNLKSLINKTDFNIAYINGMYSWYFSILPVIILKKIKNKKTIVTPRGMLSDGSVAVKKKKKKLYLYISKIFGLYQNVYFHATNQEEMNDIKKYFDSFRKNYTIANLPPKQETSVLKKIEKNKNYIKLVSIARIAPEKNLKYALEIILSCKNVNINFEIYGPVYNTAYWEECKTLISQMPDNIKIKYYGSIEINDVSKVIQNYHFLFLPTTGENYGHVIVESFLSGRPVIISNKTPWKNLEQKNAGFDIDLNDVSNFAEKIQKCALLSQNDYNLMSLAALEYGKNIADNKEVLDNYIMMFSE